jgi:hypothetical protein
VLIARPNASFARRWLEQYASFGSAGAGDEWAGLSVHFPVKLAAAHPREAVLLPHTAFFWPDWDESSLKSLLLLASEDMTPAFVAPKVDALHEWSPQPSRSSMLGRAVRALFGSAPEAGLGSLASGSPLHAGSRPSALRSRYAVHLWTRLSADYVLSTWTAEYLHTVRSSLNVEMAKIAPAPAWLQQAEAKTPMDGGGGLAGWRLDASGRRTLSHAPTPRLATPVTFWPLRPAVYPRSALLLEDISGGRSHGWIYSRGCGDAPVLTPTGAAMSISTGQPDATLNAFSAAEDGRHTPGSFTAPARGGACWAQAGSPSASAAGEGLDGLGFSLVYSNPLEGFVPLPPASAAAFSVSWYARHQALADDCGGGANWWALSFGDSRQLIAGARISAAGLLTPVLLEAAGSRPRVIARSNHASVCNNGWHHYLVSVSGPRRELLLYIDGIESARGRWGHADILPRGLWIGTSEVAISARTLPDSSIDGRRLSSLAKLALFSDAIHPGQLAPEWLAGPALPSSHTSAAHAGAHASTGAAGLAVVVAPAGEGHAAWTPEPVGVSRLAGWASMLLFAPAPPLTAPAPAFNACAACDGLWPQLEPRILPASPVGPVLALVTLLLMMCFIAPMLASSPLTSRLLRRSLSPGYKSLPQFVARASFDREAARAIEIGPWRLALRRRHLVT